MTLEHNSLMCVYVLYVSAHVVKTRIAENSVEKHPQLRSRVGVHIAHCKRLATLNWDGLIVVVAVLDVVVMDQRT